METTSKDQAIKILYQKNISLFSIPDAFKIFRINKPNTLYKLLQRLEKAEIIQRITKGKYQFQWKQPHDFVLSNFLLTPSYISLESALSFYGILPQFPYTISATTPLKTRKIVVNEKEYEYAHIEKGYFFGFTKTENFVISTPEKALLDTLYFMAKGLRKIHLEELDLKNINKKQLKIFSQKYTFVPLKKLIVKYKLC